MKKRGVAVLGITILAALVATWAFLRIRGAAAVPPQRRTRVVKVTTDSSVTAGCTLLRRINLSGGIASDGNTRDEAGRDGNLEAVAENSGGDTVLVLERAPDFVRGEIYRCGDRTP